MQENREENYYGKALKLIDSEWDNITAGQKWTAEFLEHDDIIANLCTHYSGYARDFIIIRLHRRTDIEWLEFGLKAAQKLKSRQYESNSLGNLGNAYNSLGEYQKAIEYHEQALKISREIGSKLGEGQDLGNLGNAYNSLGEYQKAIEYHEQSLEISREIGNRLGEGSSLGSLGIAYYSLEEREKACVLWKKALTIFEAIEAPATKTVRQLIETNCGFDS
jgi:tetratricopeptide (TPR) repeat protein